MLATAKKTLPSAALLCTAALSACAILAGPASAVESAAATIGATAAPSESASTPAAGIPKRSPSLHEGVALATWFGPGLFGRHTACGQLLTKHLVGVANRTLPCGTLIDFSYRGRQLTVPVVDRGPYSSIGADWDLTQDAARLLKMGGAAKIDAKIVGRVENSPELGQRAGRASSHARKAAPPPTAGPTGGVEAG